MASEYLKAAMSIESLRVGVPNRAAVSTLGCSQPALLRKFQQSLTASSGDKDSRASAGILIKGGFGSGKSHVLSWLAGVALESGFAVSRISINKETPLSDPDKLFRALADACQLPDRTGPGIFESAQKLNVDGVPFKEFESWTRTNADLDRRFELSVLLFRIARRQYELRDQIVRFWCGDPIGVSPIKKALRDLGVPSHDSVRTLRARQLALQRPRFGSRLIRAAGYKGWVWLIDEVELIASYSLLQRMRAYCQIGKLMGAVQDLDSPGLIPVLAITEDFELAVLKGKQDYSTMPAYFKTRCELGADDPDMRPQDGMLAIQRSGLLLNALGETEIEELRAKVAELYRAVYGWTPPKNDGRSFPRSTTTRQRIKYWITSWDVQRIYPNVSMRLEENRVNYEFDQDFSEPESDGKGEFLIEEILRALE